MSDWEKRLKDIVFFPFSSNRRVFKWQRRLSCGGFNEWTKYQKKSCCCCGCCYCVFSSIIQLTIFFLFRLVISCENRHRTCHYDCDNDLDLTLLLIMGVHSFNFQHNGHTRFLLLLNRHFIHTKNLDNISNWFKNILINIGFQRFTFAFQIIIIYVYRPSTHTLTLTLSHSRTHNLLDQSKWYRWQI